MKATFEEKGYRIVGVSPDTTAEQAKFIAKNDLPFILLADPGGAVATQLGIWSEKSMYGRTYTGVDRSTFVVDHAGIVRAVFHKVKPQGHAEDVLASLDAIAAG